jgi:hypothetical protein
VPPECKCIRLPPQALRAGVKVPTIEGMKTRTEVVAESQRKGLAAGLATTAAVAAGATCGSAIVAAVAAVPALLLGVRWWKHRSENGIRF